MTIRVQVKARVARSRRHSGKFVLLGKAKEAGSSRFCVGAAWRDTVGRKTNFNQILEYVKEIRGMGIEVCCTLGLLEQKQAEKLKTAGLTAYNHNLDTSREYYPWTVNVFEFFWKVLKIPLSQYQ